MKLPMIQKAAGPATGRKGDGSGNYKRCLKTNAFKGSGYLDGT